MNITTQLLMCLTMGFFIVFGFDLIKVQKEIRNEIQTLHTVVEYRIKCLPLMLDGKATMDVVGE